MQFVIDEDNMGSNLNTKVPTQQSVKAYVDTSISNQTVFNGVRLFTGSGSPEGVVAAPPGSMFTNTAGGFGTTLYVKEVGSLDTGWSAK